MSPRVTTRHLEVHFWYLEGPRHLYIRLKSHLEVLFCHLEVIFHLVPFPVVCVQHAVDLSHCVWVAEFWSLLALG